MVRIKIIDSRGGTWAVECSDQAAIDKWMAGLPYSYGKPDRWVAASPDGLSVPGEDIKQNIGTRVTNKITEYHFAAEYTVIQEDITAEVAAQVAADAQAASDKSARKAQLQNAISNWSTLTAAQKDTVLKVVLTHLVN